MLNSTSTNSDNVNQFDLEIVKMLTSYEREAGGDVAELPAAVAGGLLSYHWFSVSRDPQGQWSVRVRPDAPRDARAHARVLSRQVGALSA